MVNGGSGSVTTAPTDLPAAVQAQSSVVAVPPELSKLLQRPAKQPSVETEQPAEGQQQQRDGKEGQSVEEEGQQAEATAAGQQRRRKQRRPRAASTASDGSGSSSSSSNRKSQRRIIAPKTQGLLAWYDDAVAAAEQAYKQAGRGKPSSAPSLGKALGKPIQVGRERLAFASAACRRGGLPMVCWCSRHACAPVWSNLNLTHTHPQSRLIRRLCLTNLAPTFPQSWLDERLEYMGFEERSFPPLAPLGLPAHEEQQQQAADAAFDSPTARSCSSSGGCGSMLSHVFAEWAQEEGGGGLPVLASQWHDVPGRCACKRGGRGNSWEAQDGQGAIQA